MAENRSPSNEAKRPRDRSAQRVGLVAMSLLLVVGFAVYVPQASAATKATARSGIPDTTATVPTTTTSASTTTTVPASTTTTVPESTTTTTVPASTATTVPESTTTTTSPQGLTYVTPIAPPLITISTMAKVGDHYGILIDTHRTTPIPCGTNGGQPITDNGDFRCFYADPTPDSWLQVLVLNRASLTPVSNQDLACPTATQYPHESDFDTVPGHGSTCTKTLSDLIAGVDSNNMVVVSNQPGTATAQPPVGAAAVLGSVGQNHGIGADPVWYNSPDHGLHLPAAVRGTFSAVGVPGWAPKSGLSNSSSPAGPMGAGALVVDVTVNNQGQYQPTNYMTALATADPHTVPVSKVLFQRASPWPDLAQGCDSSKPTLQGSMAAISAVGQGANLGTDPRSQYYSQPPGYDWAERIQVIQIGRAHV